MKRNFFLFAVFFTSLLFAQSWDGDLSYPEDNPLHFGNPSDAVTEIASAENYLLIKNQFILSYNASTLCPNWVGWHLSAQDIGESGRSNKFIPDQELPEEFYRVTASDYKFSMYGFDRGHLCPSADRTATSEDNQITFLMTNMIPQAPDNNRIVWVALEKYERKLVLEGNELYIFAGPYGSGGIGQKGQFDYIPLTNKDGCELRINVPKTSWKIILCLPQGQDDFNRIDKKTTLFAVNVPNVQGCNENANWEDYECSVDYIEEITGFDFFELLPDDIEELLEK